MDIKWDVNLSGNDKRQLQILNLKKINQIVNIINDFYYYTALEAAVRETYDKYDKSGSHVCSADYIAFRASTVYLITATIAVILSIKAYKLEEKRYEDDETSYPLAANLSIVKANLITLIATIIFYKCSREFYYRTMMEESNKNNGETNEQKS